MQSAVPLNWLVAASADDGYLGGAVSDNWGNIIGLVKEERGTFTTPLELGTGITRSTVGLYSAEMLGLLLHSNNRPMLGD